MTKLEESSPRTVQPESCTPVAAKLPHEYDIGIPEFYQQPLATPLPNISPTTSLSPGYSSEVFNKSDDVRKLPDRTANLDFLPPTPALTPPRLDNLFREPPEAILSIPKPVFPVRISHTGPKPFSLESQMRWLSWKHNLFTGLAAEWRVEPAIELIRNMIQPCLERIGFSRVIFDLEPFAVGGRNTLYTITLRKIEEIFPKSYILRLALPMHPYYKLECDVATNELVRHLTDIPIPKIFAYDSSSDNVLGLEWILMEKLPGERANTHWVDIGNENHTKITRQLATWQDQLSRIVSNQIGGAYLLWTAETMEVFIGPCVNSTFTGDRAILYNVPHGPFNSLIDYYDAILQINQHELMDPVNLLLSEDYSLLSPEQKAELGLIEAKREHILSSQLHKDNLENRREGPQAWWEPLRLPAVDALRASLPNFVDDEPICTRLRHSDVSTCNFLIDSDGNITALLDWEHIDFQPIILHEAFPKFLQGKDVEEEPWSTREVFECEEDPNGHCWEVILQEQLDIITTNLRSIYKARLQELDSPILEVINEDTDGFAETLREYVLELPPAKNILAWVKYQLESDDDEELEDDVKVGDEIGLDGDTIVSKG